MQSLTLAFAAAMPTLAAIAAAIENCRSSSASHASPAAWAARAASEAATSACSARHSISAHRCLMAWKLPIGLPNCSRTLAYATAVSSDHRVTPAASAASTVAARSRTRWPDLPSGVTGADFSTTRANGREKSVARSGSTCTPSLAVSTNSQFPSAGSSRTPPSAAPSTQLTEPDAREVATSKSTLPSSAKPAKRSPSASAASSTGSSTTKLASAVVATGPGISALAASSTIAHKSSMLPPAPPRSSATATPNSPSSARPANTGRQASASPCSVNRIAVVPSSPEPGFRAQSRTNSRAANCSSVTVATTCEPSAFSM